MNDLRNQVRNFYNDYHRKRLRTPEGYQLEKYWRFFSGTVLEVGAGRWLYPGDRARYTIIEISEVALHKAAAEGVHGIQADGSSLPFADRSFTTAACHDVLEHVVNPEALLRELCRVAKTAVVIAGPNFLGEKISGQLSLSFFRNLLVFHSKAKRGFLRIQHPHLTYDDQWYPDADAISAVNARWVAEVLRENQFMVTNLETWGPGLRWFNRLPLLRDWGPFMILRTERLK